MRYALPNCIAAQSTGKTQYHYILIIRVLSAYY